MGSLGRYSEMYTFCRSAHIHEPDYYDIPDPRSPRAPWRIDPAWMTREFNRDGDTSRKSPILRAAPTGVAAYGISERPSYNKLNAENLQELQATFREVSYLIIDEKSMVGLQRLAAIDRRCRDIFPRRRDKSFSGPNIVLAGDVCQLPAVARKILF
jgi:PIF1-like helicase